MFGFGQRAGAAWDKVMRLAFCVDGYEHQNGSRRSGQGSAPEREPHR